MAFGMCVAPVLAGATPLRPAGKGKTPVVDAGALVVSKEAVEHIVNHETGGRAYFTKFYERPQDPKFASGVTIGFGYDLRYHTKVQIRRDWAGVASPSEIAAMVSVQGMDGSVSARIKWKVHITWQEAKIVFERVTLPRWAAKTSRAYGLAKGRLHPHENGAAVGNTFNRGTSMVGDSKKEKRGIRDAYATGNDGAVPALYEAQQRLWPRHSRLKLRRREEAGLARKGLRVRGVSP